MNAEIVSVGTELLLGDIANTDAQYISEQLAVLGINMFYHSVVGDNPARLTAVLKTAFARSQLVVTTGGLGPTYDDLTKEVICETLGVKTVCDEESLARIREFFAGIGKPMTENNVKQAYLPEGCTVFANDWGTAPGCAVEKDGVTVVMLPGPPRECRPMMRERVMPYLAKYAGGVIVSHRLRIFGEGESAVEFLLRDKMEAALNPTVAPYCKDGEVMLRVTAKADTESEAEALAAPCISELLGELGDLVYGVDVETLEEALVGALRSAGLTFACAESCTGGLVAKRVTDVPGSSDVFHGGIVSYSNDIKVNLLGVPPRILEKYGAVSRQTAYYMARGAARLTGADIAVGITGIAGPGGGSEEKPVGLVYVALWAHGAVYVRELKTGTKNRTRELIRHISASNALSMALRAVRTFKNSEAETEKL